MKQQPTKTKIALRFLLAGAISLLPAICFVQQKSITEAQSGETKRDKPELVVQTGHSDSINSVAFSPDGKILASGSDDNSIKLWNVDRGQEIKSLKGHLFYVFSVAFSPDGKSLASVSYESIKLWNIETGEVIKSLEGNTIYSVAFSPDGKTLASGSFNAIKLWNVDTGEEIITLEENISSVESVAFSPNGKILASGGYEAIKLWDVETGQQIISLKQVGSVNSVAFSPDGKALASGSDDNTIKLWNVNTGQQINSLKGHTSIVTSVAFSPDGKTLASGSYDYTIKLWNVGTGQIVKSFKGHTSEVFEVAFSPDGKILASGSSDNSVKLWNVENVKQIKSLSGHALSVQSVAFSSDGKILASGNHESIKLWSFEIGQQIKSLEDITGSVVSVESVTFSPNGEILASASGDYTIKLWNVKTGEKIKSLKGHTNWVHSLAFSPDGKTLASGSGDYSIKLWNIDTGIEIKSLKGHFYDVNTVAFSPDGKILASGSDDNSIKLWNVPTGQQIKSLNGNTSDDINSVVFSPDGKTLASGGLDKSVKLWNVNTGQQIKSLEGHTSEVNSVAFSLDGKIIASGSSDNLVKLWNVENGQKIKSLSGHDFEIHSIAFSPNGNFLLSSSFDATMKIWDWKENRLLATLTSLDKNKWVVATPDGQFDTNEDLNKIESLIWVLPDQPLTPKPLELYLRQYYEPGLLARVLRCNEEENCEQEFKPLPSIAEINRVQPKVAIREIKPKGNSSDLVDVVVDVENFSEEIGGKRQESGVYDLRLFRDGQLVATSAKKADLEEYIRLAPSLVEKDREAKILLNTNEDKAWRKANDLQAVAKFDKNKATFVFENVRLPHDGRKEIEFSAYAFNNDRVKSETSYKNFEIKSPTVRKGNTYLVSIGVNESENPNYNLKYAAPDAYKTQEILGERLKTQLKNSGSKLIQIQIVSDTKDGKLIKNATKPVIKGVFDLLAGKRDQAKAVSSEVPVFVDGQKISAAEIPAVQPEDTLIITYSGHGYADRNGIFYLLPYDIGDKTEKLTTEVLPKLISSDELSLWMLDVTAKEMLMVVDACHSSAAVQGDGFKPGPMGSRGLGQLAYDKGMKILSATQADNVALELGSLQQGLLSYALLQDGIFDQKADAPKDGKLFIREWLKYGEQRVPTLYEGIKNGTIKGVTIDNKPITEKQRSSVFCVDKSCRQTLQQPRLFDFNEKREDSLLINLR